jgi:nucleoid-associated protein YgaU
VEDTLRVAEERKNSPDLTHRRIVREGDHLSLMCHSIYGDPGYYLEVARFNRLNNYRQLKAGQELLFPPLKDLDHA